MNREAPIGALRDRIATVLLVALFVVLGGTRSVCAATLEPLELSSEDLVPLPEVIAPPVKAGAGQVVVLDPGHGGNDTGGEHSGGAKEKDVTLALARQIQHALDKTFSIQAVLTRSEDANHSLKERADAAQRNKGTLFVSIHTGASVAEAAQGPEIFASPATPEKVSPAEGLARLRSQRPETPPDSARIATQSLALGTAVAKSLAAETQTAPRGVHTASCRVLNQAAMPGILIEVGYLTSPTEANLLEDPAYQSKIAQGIAKGLAGYLGQTAPVELLEPTP